MIASNERSEAERGVAKDRGGWPPRMIEARSSIDARLHRRAAWARDLAIVGAVSALPAVFFPMRTFVGSTTVLLVAAFAAVGGALIGLGVPYLLHERVRRKPLVLLVPAGVGLGALWGIGATWIAASLANENLASLAPIAATVGAAQLGWFWLAYAIGLTRTGSGRWAVLAACALVPALSWLAWRHVVG